VDTELERAIASFNRAQYLEAGELFERAISSSNPEIKELVAALTQISAALHLRLERSGRQSCINLLSQAMLILEDLGPSRGGIDVERLFEEIASYTDELRASPRYERDGLKRRARLFLERRLIPKIRLTP
jgi:tetratricopeptide (TPR) repeat protein